MKNERKRTGVIFEDDSSHTDHIVISTAQLHTVPLATNISLLKNSNT